MFALLFITNNYMQWISYIINVIYFFNFINKRNCSLTARLHDVRYNIMKLSAIKIIQFRRALEISLSDRKKNKTIWDVTTADLVTCDSVVLFIFVLQCRKRLRKNPAAFG